VHFPTIALLFVGQAQFGCRRSPIKVRSMNLFLKEVAIWPKTAFLTKKDIRIFGRFAVSW
jgi:hypothetical protein